MSARSGRGESGAIMLCGLFFCVLSVSLVYYVWGIAEVIRFRERVQDGAETAAFASAVVHAHGMNLLAFFNMVMAALLAILVALRLAQLLIWVAISIIVAVGWMSGGALYSAITPLQQVNARIDDAVDAAEPVIHRLIEVVHKLGEVVARVTPAAGIARSVQVARAGYKPDVDLAAAIPERFRLPVENDDFGVLCEHAMEYATTMAMMPLPLPDQVEDGVSGALSKLAAAGSGWFCGEEGAEPPSVGRGGKENVPLPLSEARQRCQATMDPDTEVKDLGDDPCGEAALFELSSLPDRRGECRAGKPICPASCAGDPDGCPPGGEECTDGFTEPEILARAREPVENCDPLKWRLTQARTQCAPRTAGGRSGLRGMTWTQETVRRTWQYDGSDWRLEQEQPLGDAELVQLDADSKKFPCGLGGIVGSDFAESGDVCTSDGACEAGSCNRQDPRRKAGDRFVERVEVVRDLVQCVQRRKVPKAERERQAEETNVRPEGNDDSLTPFKLEEGLWLGDDEFQQRAFSYGGGPHELAEKGIKVAAWGQDTDAGVIGAVAHVLERFGLAQAEYLFQEPDGQQLEMRHRGEFLWKMGWRARLRPLRLSEGGLCGSAGGGSNEGTGAGQGSVSGRGGGTGGGGLGQVLGAQQLDMCKQLDEGLAAEPWEGL